MNGLELYVIWPSAKLEEHAQMADGENRLFLGELGFEGDVGEAIGKVGVFDVFRFCLDAPVEFGELFGFGRIRGQGAARVKILPQSGFRGLKGGFGDRFTLATDFLVFRVTSFGFLEGGDDFVLVVLGSLVRFLLGGSRKIVGLEGFARDESDSFRVGLVDDGFGDLVRRNVLWGFRAFHERSLPPLRSMRDGCADSRSWVAQRWERSHVRASSRRNGSG